MSLKVKIERPKGMSREEAEEFIYKALSAPREGRAHSEPFQDPAMQNVLEIMEQLHRKIAKDIVSEIFSEIDQESL